MDNDTIITKLMLGKEDTKEIMIDGTPIKIRPLTAGELAKLKSMEKQGIKFNTAINLDKNNTPSNSADIDTGLFMENQSRTQFQAVAWCMSVDDTTVTVEQVASLRKEIPDLIFKEVIEYSCLTEKDLAIVKSFQ